MLMKIRNKQLFNIYFWNVKQRTVLSMNVMKQITYNVYGMGKKQS